MRIFHSFPQRSWKNTKHLKNLREKCFRFVMWCENVDFSVSFFLFFFLMNCRNSTTRSQLPCSGMFSLTIPKRQSQTSLRTVSITILEAQRSWWLEKWTLRNWGSYRALSRQLRYFCLSANSKNINCLLGTSCILTG